MKSEISYAGFRRIVFILLSVTVLSILVILSFSNESQAIHPFRSVPVTANVNKAMSTTKEAKWEPGSIFPIDVVDIDGVRFNLGDRFYNKAKALLIVNVASK